MCSKMTLFLQNTSGRLRLAVLKQLFLKFFITIWYEFSISKKNKYSSKFKIFNFTVLLHFIQVQQIHQKQPPEVFYKKGVFRNFAKFTGKHLCQSFFFNKVADLRPATLLKKKLWHRRFSVNFAQFLRTLFL